MIHGGAFGAQTVTAIAPGYGATTYHEMNAQLMTIRLMPVFEWMTVTVVVKGLTGTDFGGQVGFGRDWYPFVWDGSNDPQVDIEVPAGRANLPLTTVIVDAAGVAVRIGHDEVGPFSAGAPPQPVEVWPQYPRRWRVTSPVGSVMLPGPNFVSSSVDYTMRFYSREEAEYPRLLGISSPPEADDFVLRREFFGPGPEQEIWGFQVYSAEDAIGARTHSYIRDWLANLPGGVDAGLFDVPLLTGPGEQATVNTTAPTLDYALPPDSDFAIVTIRHKTTRRLWRILVGPNTTTLKIPEFATSTIEYGEDYEWKVAAFRLPGELIDYHRYRWDRKEALNGDVSETPWRLLTIDTTD
jgi:hypothetical protein